MKKLKKNLKILDNIRIYGYSEIIVDTVFVQEDSKKFKYSVNFGGSVWNILTNLSHFFDFDCYGLGSAGNDRFSKIALKKLSSKVNCSSITVKNQSGNRLNLITNNFEAVSEIQKTQTYVRCPICQNKTYHGRVYGSINIDNLQIDKYSVLCIDSINKSSQKIIKDFKSRGAFICCDLGQIGHLRYVKKSERISRLYGFDYIQMNITTAKFLCKSEGEIGFEKLFEILNLKVLTITNSSEGSFTYYKDNGSTFEFCQKLNHSSTSPDPTGAGDAFFAGFLGQFLLQNQMVNSLTIKQLIERAQALAEKAINKVGATGHIFDLKYIDLVSATNCMICKTEKDKSTPIPQDIFKTWNKFQKKLILEENTTKIRDHQLIWNDKLVAGKRIIVTGTGGSFSTAVFCSNWLNKSFSVVTHYCKPRDIAEINLDNYDMIIAFSYSGKSADIRSVQESLGYEENIEFVLITQANSNLISKYYRQGSLLLSYKEFYINRTKERSFISFSGSLCPIIYFLSLSETASSNIINSLILKYHARIQQTIQDDLINFLDILNKKFVDIFYDKLSESAALDLESKFVETGLARVRLHEKKDFSHGRFVSIYSLPPEVIIVLNYNSKIKYEKLLEDFIKLHTLDAKYFAIQGSDLESPSLYYMLFSSALFKLFEGVDPGITKSPSYTPDAMKLYKFKS